MLPSPVFLYHLGEQTVYTPTVVKQYFSLGHCPMIQFTELKEQEKEVDSVALFEQRVVLRPDTIQAITSKLKRAYGEKFAPIILFDSKRDVTELLGEETEVRSIHEDLQKKQEQKVERKNPPEKNGQER